jgi:hypothetical protein
LVPEGPNIIENNIPETIAPEGQNKPSHIVIFKFTKTLFLKIKIGIFNPQ